MEMNDFIKKFVEQFDEIPSVELNENTRFKELEEWDSLIALSIIAMVDEEYDIMLKGDDIKNSETLKDLFDKIQEKSNL